MTRANKFKAGMKLDKLIPYTNKNVVHPSFLANGLLCGFISYAKDLLYTLQNI